MQKSKKNNITITLLLILSVLLIATTLFFSREETMFYSFDVGKPWLYSRLEADSSLTSNWMKPHASTSPTV